MGRWWVDLNLYDEVVELVVFEGYGEGGGVLLCQWGGERWTGG